MSNVHQMYFNTNLGHFIHSAYLAQWIMHAPVPLASEGIGFKPWLHQLFFCLYLFKFFTFSFSLYFSFFMKFTFFFKDMLDKFRVKCTSHVRTCGNVQPSKFKSITMLKCRGETLNKHWTKPDKPKMNLIHSIVAIVGAVPGQVIGNVLSVS